jgi:hypothetical protein
MRIRVMLAEWSARVGPRPGDWVLFRRGKALRIAEVTPDGVRVSPSSGTRTLARGEDGTVVVAYARPVAGGMRPDVLEDTGAVDPEAMLWVAVAGVLGKQRQTGVGYMARGVCLPLDVPRSIG